MYFIFQVLYSYYRFVISSETMQAVDPHAELEHRLRLEVLQAWDAFAQASRESDDPGMFAYGGTAQAFEFDAFFRYQRAFQAV